MLFINVAKILTKQVKLESLCGFVLEEKDSC